jgi:hypothetical protein
LFGISLRLQKQSEQNLVLILGQILGLQSCSFHKENCVGFFFFYLFGLILLNYRLRLWDLSLSVLNEPQTLNNQNPLNFQAYFADYCLYILEVQ